MNVNQLVHTVDAHAEGEPSRVVVGGVVDIPGETMFEKKKYLESHNDEFRKFLIHEPRGSTILHADLVLPPTNPMADVGFIIMEATDYPPMSGSNTICTVTVLLETGMLPMVEPLTNITLESPAGLIDVEAHCTNGKCERVTFTNAPSFVTHLDEKITVPGLGEVKVDVAYGGEFFVFVDAESLGYKIIDEEAGKLSQLGEEIKRAAATQLPIVHPENEGIHTISFTTFTSPPLAEGHGRNTTIVSPGRVDRSACGTATSARLAILNAKNELGIEQEYVHESILNTNFVGKILGKTKVGPYPGVITSISSRAWITGTHQLSVDPSDPFHTGLTLPDLWGRS